MRTRLLTVVVGSALAGVLTFASLHAHDADAADPIVGTWNCVVPPAGGFPQVNVIKNIHADGTMIEIDNAVPPSQESSTVGNWERSGAHSYVLTLEQFAFDPGGNFAGTFHYTNTLRSSGLNALAGPFTYALVDGAGNTLDSGQGSVSCARFGH